MQRVTNPTVMGDGDDSFASTTVIESPGVPPGGWWPSVPICQNVMSLWLSSKVARWRGLQWLSMQISDRGEGRRRKRFYSKQSVF